MKEIKDNFSGHSDNYASFRPTPPEELFDYIYKYVRHFDSAWDCGTGNGQAAVKLAERFKTVYGTDISEQQLALAQRRDNIIYRKERAEETNFADDSIDLVTVAQAIHWFDIPAFYKEVNRVAKPDAILAVWTYTNLRISPELNKITDHLYLDITYNYWDKERRLVDEGYSTIAFPFEEIQVPELEIIQPWNREQVLGYLGTWSGVQHYIQQEGKNPIDMIREDIYAAWPAGEVKEVHFPLRIRLGKIK